MAELSKAELIDFIDKEIEKYKGILELDTRLPMGLLQNTTPDEAKEVLANLNKRKVELTKASK